MANLTDKLVQLRDELQADREQNRLTNEGEVLLRNLQSGIATESVGSALQGLSLNLSDEGIGWLRSFVSDVPEQTAEMLRQLPQPIDISPQQAGAAIERLGLETYRQQFPGRAFGAELAGGMAPALVSRGRTAPETLMMAGSKGAGFGAISGYGAAEGDLGTQAEQALTGAGISALATPTLQLAGRATGKLYKSVVDGMFASPNRMGKDAARDAIRSALEADVGSVDEAMQIVLSKAGKPYSLADIGPNTRAYLDAANVLPGPGKQAAKEFLEKRDKGIAARLTSDIQDAFGSRASFFDEFNALKEARSDLGGKLYKRALSRQIPVTTELTSLLKRPSLEDAYSRGITIARERGMPVPKTRIENGKLVTDDGEVKAIDTEFLHILKMGLDDVVFTGKSPISGIGSTALNSVKDTRAQFLNFIDRNNPAYKRARDYWAGETSAMDSMQMGRNFLRLDEDELASDLRKMSLSEKEAFRLGAMQNVLDKMGGSQMGETVVGAVGNPARDLIKNPRNVRLLRLTFPTGGGGQAQFDRFIKRLTDETEMRLTSAQVLRGSQTAERTQAVAALRDRAVRELPADASLVSVIANALRRDLQGVEQQQLEATANEVTRILLERDPQRLQQIATQLQGGNVVDVFRRLAPELLPAIGRAAIGPYSVGSMLGGQAPVVQQGLSGLLGE
jgi:hypothetical protein